MNRLEKNVYNTRVNEWVNHVSYKGGKGFQRTTARRQLLRLLSPFPQSIRRTCRP